MFYLKNTVNVIRCVSHAGTEPEVLAAATRPSLSDIMKTNTVIICSPALIFFTFLRIHVRDVLSDRISLPRVLVILSNQGVYFM